MAFTSPPPDRPRYSAKIRQMRRGTDIFLPGATAESIKALACRIGAVKGREYVTRKEDGGVRVWRIA